MKYYIGFYTYTMYKKRIKEYFISEPSGLIVAGDFKNYKTAKKYITSVLLIRNRNS